MKTKFLGTSEITLDCNRLVVVLFGRGEGRDVIVADSKPETTKLGNLPH